MDRKTQAIVEQYADALTQVAFEKGLVTDIQTELTQVLAVFEETDLKSYLSSPALAHDDKVNLVRLFQESSSAYLKNFLEVILQNEREDLMADIFETVLANFSRKTKDFPITVTSAVALSDHQKERILALGNQKFDLKTQELVEKIDESIIGGFVVEANNKIIDASIRSQLQQLKNKLK